MNSCPILCDIVVDGDGDDDVIFVVVFIFVIKIKSFDANTQYKYVHFSIKLPIFFLRLLFLRKIRRELKHGRGI